MGRGDTISARFPVQTTEVYQTYWRFAAERQAIFFRKLNHGSSPFTDDPVLQQYKFTNAYRASDRVSQFLIRHVIYGGTQSPSEVFFRILLFKIFNKIETWKLLETHCGEIRYATYSFEKYDNVLCTELAAGRPIFSGAYIMPTGSKFFGHPRKHQNQLRLLELMMKEQIPHRLSEAKSMHDAFELLRTFPTIGDFLAYQYVTDLNYSTLIDFSEMEFVMPGPGARSGIQKCFRDLGGLSESDIIRLVTERQEIEFERLGIQFRTLWGRKLQLIDCQNLFCEVDKYARLVHPTVAGIGNRTRIKQTYTQAVEPIAYWYPPKWKLPLKPLK